MFTTNELMDFQFFTSVCFQTAVGLLSQKCYKQPETSRPSSPLIILIYVVFIFERFDGQFNGIYQYTRQK